MVSSGDSNAIGSWIRAQFRESPWTSWIVAINLVCWLSQFFGYGQVAGIVAGELSVQTAWRWLTYPLFTPAGIGFFLIGMFVFHWISSSLERQWGSEEFLRVFVVVVLATAFSHWAAMAVVTQNFASSVALAGVHLPLSTLFVIWAGINAEATILAFFVIPVKAKYLAYFSMIVTVLGGGLPAGLIHGVVPITGWFWAQKRTAGLFGGQRKPSKSISNRIDDRRRERKKSRFKVLEGNQAEPKSKSSDLPKAKVPDLRELNREAKAKEKSANEAELDRILDKIRFEGMAALTPEEKAALDRQSQRLKDEG